MRGIYRITFERADGSVGETDILLQAKREAKIYMRMIKARLLTIEPA